MAKATLPIVFLFIAATGVTEVNPPKLPVIAGLAQSSITNTLARPHPASGPIQPIPLQTDGNPAVAALGKRLFTDRWVDVAGERSCADCHDLRQGGANGKRITQTRIDPKRTDADDEMEAFNTPTIFNVAFNKNYYWSARFDSLDQQLDDAIKELGLNWDELIAKLRSAPQYVASFNAVFPDGITVPNVKQAIIAYEQTLVTPNSRFDRFLRGDSQALSAGERQGYELFKSYGCAACHQGINAGGNLAIAWSDLYPDRGTSQFRNIPTGPNRVSLGVRGGPKIRVPGLRNVALTAPYFHDGSVDTLEQAVTIMAETLAGSQPGVRIPRKDIVLIAAFLRTLTGEYNGKAL